MRPKRSFPCEFIAVAFASVLILSMMSACGKEKENTPTSMLMTATTTPTSDLKFFQPACDIDGASDFEGHNEIIRIFHQTTGISDDTETYRVEYNIVLRDEDAPIGDNIYDPYRKDKYGRIADIETLVVYGDKETGSLKRIEFPDTYSGSQQFFTAVPQHQSKEIYKPKRDIYINTWNHLFAEYDTNPDLEKYVWILDNGQYKCNNGITAEYSEGSREDAEVWVKGTGG